jgi:hypothetical protein
MELIQKGRRVMKKIILAFTILFIYFSAAAQQGAGKMNKLNTSLIKNEQKLPELKVYPNPCKDSKVTLEMENQELSEIKITNITGKQIYFNKLAIPESKKQIQFENIPNGVYLIQIKTTQNKLIAKKLLITSN